VRALLASLERVDREVSADTGLIGSSALGYRLQGALVALHAVLGDLSVDAIAARMTG
jgi:hypothetical protein